MLSRRKAKEQISVEDFNKCTRHLVANHSEGNVDEAPAAYKDIFEVMELQKELVDVIDRVTPILNIKG
jgi:tRNA-splicing ligase RtcB